MISRPTKSKVGLSAFRTMFPIGNSGAQSLSLGKSFRSFVEVLFAEMIPSYRKRRARHQVVKELSSNVHFQEESHGAYSSQIAYMLPKLWRRWFHSDVVSHLNTDAAPMLKYVAHIS